MPQNTEIFPTLKARSLTGQNWTLPDDLTAVHNVVLVAFQRWHQRLVDEWMVWLAQATTDRPDVAVYEVPVLSHLYMLMRPMIDGGMAAAITSEQVRTHTLTVYDDIDRIARNLGLGGTSTIGVFLVGQDGHIRWRGRGGYEAELAASLERALREPPA